MVSGATGAQLDRRALALKLRLEKDELPAGPVVGGPLEREHRLAIAAADRAQLAALLEAFLRREPAKGLHVGQVRGPRPRIVFVCSGFGSDSPSMGRDLYAFSPDFRRVIDAFDELNRPLAGFSLAAELTSGGSSVLAWREPEILLPAVMAVQVGLAAHWRSLGVHPDVVVGQSSGEVAAATIAGILELEDAVRLAHGRARLLARTRGPWKMLLAMVDAGRAERELKGLEGVQITAVNGPAEVIVSGHGDAIETLRRRLERAGAVVLASAYLSHSSRLDPFEGEFMAGLAGVAPREGTIPYHSSVTGERIDGRSCDVAYWWRTLRDPVLLHRAVTRVLDAGPCAFVEISPHPVLARPLTEAIEVGSLPSRSVVVGTLRRNQPDRLSLLDSLARLFVHGIGPAAAGDGAAPPPEALDEEVARWRTADAARERPATGTLWFLREQIAALVGAPVESIDPDARLAALGIDSIRGLELCALAERRRARRLPPHRLIGATVGEIAALLDAPRDADARAPTSVPPAHVDPARRHAPFHLTELQEAYWVGHMVDSELSGPAYAFLELDCGEVDAGRLESAWNRLIERHDVLRAVVEDGRWRVLPEVPRDRIAFVDLTAKDEPGREEQLARSREEMAAGARAPGAWPLCELRLFRTAPGRHLLQVRSSLLVLDFPSWAILTREWEALYDDPGASLPALALSYRDYAVALAAFRETETYERSLAYWRARAQRLPPGPHLPPPRGERAGAAWGQVLARIGRERASAFRARATERGLSLAPALIGCFAEVVAAWAGERHFTLSLLQQQRLPVHPEVRRLVGRFSSILPLEVDFRGRAPFGDRVVSLAERLALDHAHGAVDGIRVARESSRTRGELHAISPVVLSSAVGTGELPLSWLGRLVRRELRTPHVALDVQMAEHQGELLMSWDFRSDRLAPAAVEEMARALEHLVASLGAPDAWSADRPELLDERHLAPRRRANDTAAPLPSRALHELLEEHAAARPDAPAVISRVGRHTHRELDLAASDLAARLVSAGAGPGGRVAVYSEQGWEAIVALQAILKAGAAYLPIDAHLVPPERATRLMEDGRVAAAVTRPHLAGRVAAPGGVPVILLPGEPAAPAAPEPSGRSAPGDVAYVIYTSGSTGRPKGVVIDHRAAANTIADINRRFDVGSGDRTLALSSIGFDLSVYDVFGVLGAGGAIVVPDRADRLDPSRWLELIARERVTIWNTVPSLLGLLADHVEALGTPAARAQLAGLRLVLLSGDWIPVELPDRFRALCPAAEVVSLGGATEASIWSIAFPIRAVSPSWESIPYGFPLSNQTFHVLDDGGSPSPTSVQGHLHIGGAGLARGYWDDAERTAAAFIDHPSLGRLYRTGDLGRYQADGCVELLGRQDSQVKVNGYRVELGEIERALLDAPSVRDAHVVAEREGGRVEAGRPRGTARRLLAYVVPRPGASLDLPVLRALLSARLPSYMVPAQILEIDSMPLSANGKVDPGALPGPDRSPADVPVATAAEGTIEAALRGIWSALLEIDIVPSDASFFELGGTSVDAVRLISRVQAQLGRRLSLDDLLRAPTLHALADRVSRLPQGGAGCCLVRLPPGGEGPPLFLVHPVGGGVLCYAGLARALAGVVPCVGIQAHGLDGASAPFSEMAALAAHYAERVQAFAPAGPVRLAGWSLGGAIAVEVAALLAARGRVLEPVILIDSWAPLGTQGPDPDRERLREWFLGEVRRTPAPGADRPLDHLPAAELESLFAVYRAHARIGRRHAPARYAGPVTLLAATARPAPGWSEHPALRHPALARPDLGWGEYLASLSVIHVPGDHYTILGGAGLEAIVEAIAGAGARELLA